MFVVQDTFKTKPGKANALVEVFKAAAPHLRGARLRSLLFNLRVAS